MKSTLGFVLAGLIVAACSHSDSSGPPDSAHFAGAMASSFCGALHACCDAQKIPYDDGSCVAQLQATFQTAIDVVKRGKVVYDPNAVAACQDAFKNRESKCADDAGSQTNADGGFLDPIAAACWPVLKGTVALGGECTTSAECASPGPSVSAGCQTDNRPGADPSVKVCFNGTQHVLPGGACRSTPKTDADGTLHFETASCEPTLGYCDTSQAPMDDRAAGTCVAYANVGDDCVGTNPQMIPRCNPTTSYCDYSGSKQCVALPQAGDACATNGVFLCAPGNYCDRNGGNGAGTCTATKPDGSSCAQSQECASQFCQFTVGDGGVSSGTCSSFGNGSHSVYDISPRTCGFGPSGSGPEDGGIVTKTVRPSLGGDGQWYLVR